MRTSKIILLLLLLLAVRSVHASENVPHAPFAQWVKLPARGQLEVGAVYQESEAYYFWDASQRYDVDTRSHGEHYGIDINQGYLALRNGITERWAADLAVGYTSLGWRSFTNYDNPGHSPRSTTGLMDIAFGVRENHDSIQAGLSYTTARHRIRYEFYTRSVFDGSNTDKKFWIGGGISVPIQITKQTN
jgi:hypothetical protein